jgi:hypothetical protein
MQTECTALTIFGLPARMLFTNDRLLSATVDDLWPGAQNTGPFFYWRATSLAHPEPFWRNVC